MRGAWLAFQGWLVQLLLAIGGVIGLFFLMAAAVVLGSVLIGLSPIVFFTVFGLPVLYALFVGSWRYGRALARRLGAQAKAGFPRFW